MRQGSFRGSIVALAFGISMVRKRNAKTLLSPVNVVATGDHLCVSPPAQIGIGAAEREVPERLQFHEKDDGAYGLHD